MAGPDRAWPTGQRMARSPVLVFGPSKAHSTRAVRQNFRTSAFLTSASVVFTNVGGALS